MVAQWGGASERLLAEHQLLTERSLRGSLESAGHLQWLVSAAAPKALPPPAPPPSLKRMRFYSLVSAGLPCFHVYRLVIPKAPQLRMKND